MTGEWTTETAEHATFVVRLTRGDRGGLTAIVERVRTGEKARVEEVEHLGGVLLRMLEAAAHEGKESESRATSPEAEASGDTKEID